MRLRQVRAARIAILGMVFGLFLLAEVALQSALHKGWTTFGDHDALGTLTVDQQGRVWAVVNDLNQSGVSVASIILHPGEGEPVQFPLPDRLAGIPLPDGTSDSILSLTVDHQEQVWARTLNGLIAIRDVNDQWTYFGPEHMEGPLVTEIVIDGQGQAWTNSGNLARIVLDPAAGTYELVDVGVENVDTLTVDAKGQLGVLRTNGDVMTLLPDGTTIPIVAWPVEDWVSAKSFTTVKLSQ